MAIPWFQIVRLVPEVVSLSKELLKQSQSVRRAGAKTSEERVAALEEHERQQAELVANMAQQLAAVADAVTSMRKQFVLLRIISTISLLAAVLAIILAVT